MKLKLNKSRRDAQQAMLSTGLLAGAAGIGVARNKDALIALLPDLDRLDGPAAVMFVTDDSVQLSRPQGGAINSWTVRDWCVDNNVQYRKYREDSDMFQVSYWAREMHKVGLLYGAPCMVTIDRNGRGRAYSVPSGSAKTIELLKKVMA